MTKQRAKGTAAAVKKGAHTSRKAKMWTKVIFRLPKTLAKKRDPIALKKSVKKESTWDKYSIVKYPLSSESAIKTAIRKACQDLYNIKVRKVNTLITPKGNKKAYVVLSKVHDALEIANKIGIM